MARVDKVAREGQVHVLVDAFGVLQLAQELTRIVHVLDKAGEREPISVDAAAAAAAALVCNCIRSMLVFAYELATIVQTRRLLFFVIAIR